MSVGSFSASLSGLNANQQKLSVIGNNLANINTTAFKASNVTFSDLVSQSIGGPSENPTQIGLGASVGSITPNFTQGSIETTGVATNVCVDSTLRDGFLRGYYIIVPKEAVGCANQALHEATLKNVGFLLGDVVAYADVIDLWGAKKARAA